MATRAEVQTMLKEMQENLLVELRAAVDKQLAEQLADLRTALGTEVRGAVDALGKGLYDALTAPVTRVNLVCTRNPLDVTHARVCRSSTNELPGGDPNMTQELELTYTDLRNNAPPAHEGGDLPMDSVDFECGCGLHHWPVRGWVKRGNVYLTAIQLTFVETHRRVWSDAAAILCALQQIGERGEAVKVRIYTSTNTSRNYYTVVGTVRGHRVDFDHEPNTRQSRDGPAGSSNGDGGGSVGGGSSGGSHSSRFSGLPTQRVQHLTGPTTAGSGRGRGSGYRGHQKAHGSESTVRASVNLATLPHPLESSSAQDATAKRNFTREWVDSAETIG